MIKELISLFYPSLCAACGDALLRNELGICTGCMMDLPYTNYHQYRDNPVMKLFWGRTSLHFATSLCYFSKATHIQHLLHELKYRGNTQVGEILGKELGKQIADSPYFGKIDCVVPVPLHPKKEKKRGYNQSAFIAEGIAAILEVPVENKLLLRNRNNETQTRKSRYRRWENVESIFSVAEPEVIYEKQVLLVDDVVTTGATLEACCETVLKHPGARVSIATLACA